MWTVYFTSRLIFKKIPISVLQDKKSNPRLMEDGRLDVQKGRKAVKKHQWAEFCTRM